MNTQLVSIDYNSLPRINIVSNFVRIEYPPPPPINNLFLHEAEDDLISQLGPKKTTITFVHSGNEQMYDFYERLLNSIVPKCTLSIGPNVFHNCHLVNLNMNLTDFADNRSIEYESEWASFSLGIISTTHRRKIIRKDFRLNWKRYGF